jgi:hypothetical protein
LKPTTRGLADSAIGTSSATLKTRWVRPAQDAIAITDRAIVCCV